MPVNYQETGFTNMVLTSASGAVLAIYLYNSGGTLLAHFNRDVGPIDNFTSDTTGGSTQSIRIIFELVGGGALGFSAGDTLAITGSSISCTVNLSDDIADGDEFWLDNNGVLFDNQALSIIGEEGDLDTESISFTEDDESDEYNFEYVDTLGLSAGTEQETEVEYTENIVAEYTIDKETAFKELVNLIKVGSSKSVDSEKGTLDSFFLKDSVEREFFTEIQQPLTLSMDYDLSTKYVEDGLSVQGSSLFTGQLGLPLNSSDLPEDLGIGLEECIFVKYGPLDFDHRGLKHLVAVELFLNTSDDVYCAIDYKYQNANSYRSTVFRKLQSNGIFNVNITATLFKLKILIPENTDTQSVKINFYVKYVDKRAIRGVNLG